MTRQYDFGISTTGNARWMGVSGVPAGESPYAFDGLAAAVLDDRGVVLRWTGKAWDLTGFTAEEVCGRPVLELVADLPGEVRSTTQIPASGRVWLRHRSRDPVHVTFRSAKLEGSADFLVLAAPTRLVADHEQGAALLRALSAQDRITIALHDADLTIRQTNAPPGAFFAGTIRPGARLGDVLCAEDATDLEAVLRQVLETGTPVIRRIRQVSRWHEPSQRQALSLSAYRLEDARGHPSGVAALYTDATDQLRARSHLDLARRAAEHVGTSLDVVRTAQQLADVLVPTFGDLVTVDLAQAVFDGDEPPERLGGGDLHLRTAGMAPAAAQWPAGIKAGGAVPPVRDNPLLRSFQHGRTVVFSRDDYRTAIGDPRMVEYLFPDGAHSVMFAPLYARGLLLGGVSVWRVGRTELFTEDDAQFLALIASRGALAVDNARRYAREHLAAMALQQRLLPPAATDTAAAETVGMYLPAGGGAHIGGDWFDAIALPSFRLALVAGDVIGHGMAASAAMGRLRTAIQTLADLELDPDELLTRIEDLVERLTAEASPVDQDTVGATCLYAVYDPVTRRCTLASAGHPPPVLIRPTGTAEAVEVTAGPPLGVGGLPYETTTISLEPGSVLALYTDGLIEHDDGDIDHALRRLSAPLATACDPDRALEDTGRALLAELAGGPLRDDVALLLARTRAVPPQDSAYREFPADPAAVCEVREWTALHLTRWGLEDRLFATEVVVSELVTNAIRYGCPPLRLRLVRHRETLVCEVTDASATQPRLRRARSTDEGGRGLFLVAQLSARWGCRYGQDNKTIWTEQRIA
ncbi:ATP-binding SpoIIE family protein phosphatase [Streptacidiphilus griseoplanus]|uniref:ATP-binding SpoIIE family protein phosphatase n=1 Tax=Peterkaempfera griseoplana TaxID=66896 RepID=UPI00099EA1CC|nr:SpoIIE family protein phosphatase [Peterkaempfera griseoplana]